MGDSKLKEMLEQADKETADLINNKEKEAKESVADFQERFKSSINSKIYATFGEYLYNALGHKINSQTKNKILQAYKDNNEDDLQFVINPDTGKTRPMNDDEIFASLHEHSKKANWYGSQNTQYDISHATVGANFGFGYVTPGKSVYSISIPANYIFFYLTQEHVDLISNKDKRACAQEFLQYRDSFMSIRNQLRDQTEINVDLDIELAKITNISSKNSIGKSSYYSENDEKKNYLTLDETSTDKINKVEVLMRNVTLRDTNNDTPAELIKGATSKGLRRRFNSKLSDEFDVLINIFKRNGSAKDKSLCYHGSIMLTESETYTPLNITEIKGGNSTCCYFVNGLDSRYGSRQVSKLAEENDGAFSAKSFLMNWKDVINEPKVRQAIDQRIKFFEMASKTLHHLKKKHAKLVFVFGAF